jgi:hypothetical protein
MCGQVSEQTILYMGAINLYVTCIIRSTDIILEKRVEQDSAMAATAYLITRKTAFLESGIPASISFKRFRKQYCFTDPSQYDGHVVYTQQTTHTYIYSM